MYISAYCDWCIDLDDVCFFDQQLACFVAYLADLGLGNDFAGAKLGNGPIFICQREASTEQ